MSIYWPISAFISKGWAIAHHEINRQLFATFSFSRTEKGAITLRNITDLMSNERQNHVNGTRVISHAERARVPHVNFDFPGGDFWKRIPAWKNVSRKEFADHRWQQVNSIKSTVEVIGALEGQLCGDFIDDLLLGLEKTPMRVRITPYIFSLIDWTQPAQDPIRRQFLPLGSQFIEDHPNCMDDSLNEEGDRCAPFLTHRYPDKVLFLPVSVCPVYCSYCTRSRLVGGSTAHKAKSIYGASKHKWNETFDYIRSHPEIEDVVISGGDAFMLPPDMIEHIGTSFLAIPHIRRIRFATKGIAVLPMKITNDDAWVKAIQSVADQGRKLRKEVSIHTHFNSDYEMTDWTCAAMHRLTDMGIKVRNQSVLLRGVNDSFDCMYRTIKKLASLHIQPYLVFIHDMVPGCEHLRTTLAEAERISRELQGTTAGFNVPRFVCDAPGGGGKREISSYQHYDRQLGISAWTAPRIKPGKVFYYYDPIDQLPEEGKILWHNRIAREEALNRFKNYIANEHCSK